MQRGKEMQNRFNKKITVGKLFNIKKAVLDDGILSEQKKKHFIKMNHADSVVRKKNVVPKRPAEGKYPPPRGTIKNPW